MTNRSKMINAYRRIESPSIRHVCHAFWSGAVEELDEMVGAVPRNADAVEFCKLRYNGQFATFSLHSTWVEAPFCSFSLALRMACAYPWRFFFFSPTLHDVKTTSPFCTFEYIHTHTYSAFALVCGRNQYFFVGVKCVCACVCVCS